MDLGLEGKVALVTGSYRGTGAGIAETLAAEGARVWVHGFEPGQAEPVAQRLRAAGGDAHAITGGLFNDDDAQALAHELLARAGRVDVLVNNYGVAEPGRWLAPSTDDWISIYQKNVLSGVRLVRAFAPGMRERGWGRIVWLGTIGSLRPAARMPHYYASKAVLPTLCVSLAKELAGSGITVNLVSPGLIATAEVVEQRARRKVEGAQGAAGGAGGPFENAARITEVAEVASLVAYVASERAAAINAANLRIDGGASECAVA
jgi:3-oxoacyl-[acyl-carrier protein] reductase